MKMEDTIYCKSPFGTIFLRANRDALLEVGFCDERIAGQARNPLIENYFAN